MVYNFHPEHPSPELVGRDNSLGWQEQLPRHLLATTVPLGSTARTCRRESWAARSSSPAGVSQVFVPSCAAHPAVLRESELRA